MDTTVLALTTGPVSPARAGASPSLVEAALDTLRDETGAIPVPRPAEPPWRLFLRRIGLSRSPSPPWTPIEKPRWFLDVESEQPFRAYILAPGGTKVLVSRKQAAQILGALGFYQHKMQERNPHLKYR